MSRGPLIACLASALLAGCPAGNVTVHAEAPECVVTNQLFDTGLNRVAMQDCLYTFDIVVCRNLHKST